MNLKIYNTINVPITRRGASTIRINRKAGVIAFSKEAAKEIGLVSGSRVVLYQDETRPADWYVSKTESDNGFVCRDTTKTKGQFAFNSCALVEMIFKSIDFSGNSASMKIGMPDDGMFPIITKSIQA